MNTPTWLKLLDSHCQEKDGLSLPYLVGASDPPESTSSFTLATTVIEEMRAGQQSKRGVYLSFCGRLKVPVFTMLPQGYGTGLRVELDEYWGDTDEEKIRKVIDESKEPIESGCFSRIQQDGIWCWTPYTDTDCIFIVAALRD